LTYTLEAPALARETEKLKVVDLVYAATLPFDNGFAITSRAGLAYTNSSGNGAIRDFGGHAIRVTGGLGVKYDITENFSLRADWNGYSAPPAAKIDNGFINAFTVGVGYKF
jgi:opacity protein-like surface antigen